MTYVLSCWTDTTLVPYERTIIRRPLYVGTSGVRESALMNLRVSSHSTARDAIERRILPVPTRPKPSFPYRGERARNVHGEEQRHNLADHLPKGTAD